MTYRIEGLKQAGFRKYFGWSADELRQMDAIRVIADADVGYPCRVTLEDARAGEPVILLNFASYDLAGPFHTTYAIFVRELEAALDESRVWAGELPPILRGRPLSLRGFDAEGLLHAARLAESEEVEDAIADLFAMSEVAYIHAYYAIYGCFAARIERPERAGRRRTVTTETAPKGAVSADRAWRAVLARDKAFDGRFVTGVLSTGIYCRPSCSARHPRRENVRFFAEPSEAEVAGLRACLRCRPGDIARDEEAVTRALALLDEAGESPSLGELAEAVGYSPTHFQRVFKRAIGLSPAAYMRARRAERAGDVLSESASVTEAIYDAGFGAASRFYELSQERMGMAPSVWREGGRGVTIHWAVVATTLGEMLVAATGKGVCRLSFAEGREHLEARFPRAELVEGGVQFERLLADVVGAVEQPGRLQTIPLDVQGTAFQEAVWRELRRIPAGETRTYAQIAAAIGKPGAVRAAGSANGANNVAVLIPCHRVIRADGSVGGYAYGEAIKNELLKRERG